MISYYIMIEYYTIASFHNSWASENMSSEFLLKNQYHQFGQESWHGKMAWELFTSVTTVSPPNVLRPLSQVTCNASRDMARIFLQHWQRIQFTNNCFKITPPPPLSIQIIRLTENSNQNMEFEKQREKTIVFRPFHLRLMGSYEHHANRKAGIVWNIWQKWKDIYKYLTKVKKEINIQTIQVVYASKFLPCAWKIWAGGGQTRP